jgi:ferritin-like metal-binding protein YciE
MENLTDLLVAELRDIYSAEKQIVKALPKMVRGAASADLKQAISEHLEVTKAQVSRLEDVFAQLEEKPRAKHCKGMEGLLEEGAECLQEEEAGTLRDLQIIGAAQRVEHYEVAAYGTAKTIAEKLGLSEAAELLGETLSEEEEADRALSEVAEALYEEVNSDDSEDEESEDDESDEDSDEESDEDEDEEEGDEEGEEADDEEGEDEEAEAPPSKRAKSAPAKKKSAAKKKR